MKILTYVSAAMMAIAALGSCSGQKKEATAEKTVVAGDSVKIDNEVIETIMSRRSVRAYLPNPVGRDTMDVILKCGINAPNGMNRQPWELRVVDNPEFLAGITKKFAEQNPDMAKSSKFIRNMFRDAPTVVFIAAENNSQLDCGLLGENMVLAAWSMGIGSCCLGGPIGFMKSENGAEYLKQLGFSDGYELVYAIGFGYPAESPDAKPRDESKIKYL